MNAGPAGRGEDLGWAVQIGRVVAFVSEEPQCGLSANLILTGDKCTPKVGRSARVLVVRIAHDIFCIIVVWQLVYWAWHRFSGATD